MAFLRRSEEPTQRSLSLKEGSKFGLPVPSKPRSDASDTLLIKPLAQRIARSAYARSATVAGPAIAASSRQHFDVLVVGAGFAGAVLAERLARGSQKRVLLIDRRPHIGGNAFDHFDSAGILIHQYGPHIFHTNSDEVFQYLSRFTRWRPYQHRVRASVEGKLLPMPINRTTLSLLYGKTLATEEEAASLLAGMAEQRDAVVTSEDVVVSSIGRDLYEKFFRGYTRKQWGLDPSQLDKSVAARVPARTNTDDRYFTDKIQMMPLHGYTRMFENMLDHPNIVRELGVDFDEIRDQVICEKVIFTGPIDEYFDYCYGKLPYRSLRFDHKTLDKEWSQEVAVVNYPDEKIPYTRITEYKHLTGQSAPKTSISYEYPCGEGDYYYPIPRPENQALYRRYEELARTTPGVLFAGRLGTYRYYNMDQVVGQALSIWRRMHGSHASPSGESSKAVQPTA